MKESSKKEFDRLFESIKTDDGDKTLNKELLNELFTMKRKERTPLEVDLEAQDHFKEFVKVYAILQEQMRPIKEKLKKLSEIYKEKGYLSAEQIRLAKRIYTIMKSDLPVEDLPAAVDMFLDGESNVVSDVVKQERELSDDLG